MQSTEWQLQSGNALMADEGYAGSTWDHNMNHSPDSPVAVNSSLATGQSRPSLSLQSSANSSYSPRDSPNSALPHLALNSVSSPPQSSSESAGNGASSKWRDGLRPLERRDTITSLPSDAGSIVEPSFDENVLRALCEMDASLPPEKILHFH